MDMVIMIVLAMDLIMVFNGFLIIGSAGMVRKKKWERMDEDDGR